MKKLVIVSVLGLFAATGAFAQEGELVSVDAETLRSYYTRNDNFTVEDDGSFSGNIVAYFDNGTVEETGALSRGTKVGTWLKYNDEGQKTGKGSYLDGKKHGEWKVWDGTGTLRIVMNYEEGKRVGEWLFYNEKGEVIKRKDYAQSK